MVYIYLLRSYHCFQTVGRDAAYFQVCRLLGDDN